MELVDYQIIAPTINLYFFITLILHWIYRNHPAIKKRNLFLQFFAAINMIVAVNLLVAELDPAGSQLGTTCFTRVIFSGITLNNSVLCMILRAFSLSYSYFVNQAKLGEEGIRNLTRFEHLTFYLFADRNHYRSLKKSGFKMKSSSVSIQSVKMDGSIDSSMNSPRGSQFPFSLKMINNDIPRKNLIMVLLTMTLIQTIGNAILMVTVITPGELHCSLIGTSVITVPLILQMMFIPWLNFVIRRSHDNHYIRLELMAEMAVGGPLTIMYFVAHVLPSLSFGQSSEVYSAIGMFVAYSLSITFPVILSIIRKTTAKTGKVDVETFEAMLADPKMFAEFKQVLAADLCIENGIFYETYMNTIKENTGSKQKAMRSIYNNFIAPGSLYELNIYGKLSKNIQEGMENPEADFSLLTPVLEEVKRLMYDNSFPKYISRKRRSESS